MITRDQVLNTIGSPRSLNPSRLIESVAKVSQIARLVQYLLLCLFRGLAVRIVKK